MAAVFYSEDFEDCGVRVRNLRALIRDRGLKTLAKKTGQLVDSAMYAMYIEQLRGSTRAISLRHP
jgi:hypothetical protein